MRGSQRGALCAVVLAVLWGPCSSGPAPAKLDHLTGATSTHKLSRGGFRAGFHDTGIWGANLQKPNQLTPPVWGENSLISTKKDSAQKSTGSPVRGQKDFGAKAILAAASNVVPQQSRPSSSALSQAYLPPVEAPTQQAYNYIPPQKPFNFYQPPTTTTTTTTTTTKRPPPPPPSGLYETPIKFRPIPQRPLVPAKPVTPAPLPPPPSGLYETPRLPPPPPPSGLYETPIEDTPAPTPRPTPRPPPPPPSGLYETPQENRPVPQTRPPPPPSPSKNMMFGMPYDFAYGVSDQDSGNYFDRQENHDGNVMRGQYKVLLPDGRTQVVTYFDDGNGFNADVTYE